VYDPRSRLPFFGRFLASSHRGTLLPLFRWPTFFRRPPNLASLTPLEVGPYPRRFDSTRIQRPMQESMYRQLPSLASSNHKPPIRQHLVYTLLAIPSNSRHNRPHVPHRPYTSCSLNRTLAGSRLLGSIFCYAAARGARAHRPALLRGLVVALVSKKHYQILVAAPALVRAAVVQHHVTLEFFDT
jgi:hypothetical protein